MAAVGTMHLGDFTLLLYPNFVQEDCILHNKTTAIQGCVYRSKLSTRCGRDVAPMPYSDLFREVLVATFLLPKVPNSQEDFASAVADAAQREGGGGGGHGHIAPLTLGSLICVEA